MKNKIYAIIASILTLVSATGCGSSSELTRFKQDVESFCSAVSELDESINNVDADSASATAQVLKYLDQLDNTFQDFSELEFPKEFQYLEPLADEAAEYMSTAVKSYHEAYADDGYQEEIAAYAKENSARALKRIQIILSFLQGKEPQQ